MPRALRSPVLWFALLVVALALGFLGTRGLWDPDEGRYTNVALNMLDSGDWLNPRRNDEVGHWTKPPLTYWAIASSVAAFGPVPFAARLPSALSYLLCVWLVGRIARRLLPGRELDACVVYATMLLPFGASQLITTDFLLSACETLALAAFVEARFGAPAQARRWLVAMWAAFGLAFLAKGPPGLLPLLAVAAFDALMPGKTRHRVLQAGGLLLFALLALPWYVAVVHGHPGLLEYFLGRELVDRMASNGFDRHGQWYGWLLVYLPTLLLGSLPWTPALLRWTRTLPARVRGWRDPAVRTAQAARLLPVLWLALPLVVFCLSRSRLPLYVLPLFVPLALVIAAQRGDEGRTLPRWPWLTGWAALLLALKLVAAFMPSEADAAGWARAIRERAGHDVREVVFVEDVVRYGLHLELGRHVQIERVSMRALVQSRFNPAFDEDLAKELAEREPGVVWICRRADWPVVQARIRALGSDARPLGPDYRGRVLFRVTAAAAAASGPGPRPRRPASRPPATIPG